MRDTPIEEDSQGDEEDEEDAPGEGNGDDVAMTE